MIKAPCCGYVVSSQVYLALQHCALPIPLDLSYAFFFIQYLLWPSLTWTCPSWGLHPFHSAFFFFTSLQHKYLYISVFTPNSPSSFCAFSLITHSPWSSSMISFQTTPGCTDRNSLNSQYGALWTL